MLVLAYLPKPLPAAGKLADFLFGFYLLNHATNHKKNLGNHYSLNL